MNTPPSSPIHAITGLDPAVYDADEALAIYSVQLQMYDNIMSSVTSSPPSAYGLDTTPVLGYWGTPLDSASAMSTPFMHDDMVIFDYWPMQDQALFVDLGKPLALAPQHYNPHDGGAVVIPSPVTTATTSTHALPIAVPVPTAPSGKKVLEKREQSCQKKHSCTLCNRSFSRKTDLRRHYRTSLRHSQKQYPCTHCNHIFTRPHDVKRHAAKAHDIQSTSF